MTEPSWADETLPEDLEEAALEILEGDDDARAAAIDELLSAHPRHARALRNWLVAAGAIEGDWHGDEGDAEQAGDDDRLPRRLGPYLLQAVIGRGGFGTVYRSDQQEPIRRPVAVKVLNPGMDSREILARFTAEREALNRMDHPCIARLLDAGTTPKGRPFFAMELVEGPTLVAWCRRQKVPMRQRIELFLQVCDAMQHAHQKQVLHRDLSSNNVLLATTDEGPRPKIIDFGIAKSLADPLLQGGAMTFQGTLMGTPEFMSPEQAAGRVGDVDTRADVYALGVQLYELLTEQLPIPGVVLRAQGVAGMARVIASHQPSRASDIAPPGRAPALRGDLDAILGKALQKEREHRYAGVGELAADLRRYLADQPVEVATPTTWYRLRKFVRRNRGQSIAFAAAALLLTVSLVLLTLALQRANREASLREQANRELKDKADAGFRLLANEDRIEQGRRLELELPPPWPEHLDAYDRWNRTFAESLTAERIKVQARLLALANRREQQGGELLDPVDRHLERALLRLREHLDTFLGDDGTAARVAARMQWSRETFADDRQYDDVWRRARAAIRASDGDLASTEYRGLPLPRLPGLVPIGCHPRTKLWEFLDLRTHADGYPLPTRDTRSGDLQTDAGTGVVLVLVPGGRIAVGARRNEPGMDRNDEHASSDELNDAIVALEPFLVARTELSVVQFARLTGRDLSNLDPRLPMTDVDWHTSMRELRRWGMTLPTEVQWEYACRAGTSTPWCSGSDPEAAAAYGWFDGAIALCGQLRSNRFGLCDVHGNVREWCRDEKLPYPDFDARADDGLRARAERDPMAWRAVRGGSVRDGALGCRSTTRYAHAPDGGDGVLGLRPIRVISR
ncbi:MAG: bifunctional serine/threonine-protein kinase/formylglycine-generating enzyme family protein [Planctomycetota bacterium]